MKTGLKPTHVGTCDLFLVMATSEASRRLHVCSGVGTRKVSSATANVRHPKKTNKQQQQTNNYFVLTRNTAPVLKEKGIGSRTFFSLLLCFIRASRRARTHAHAHAHELARHTTPQTHTHTHTHTHTYGARVLHKTSHARISVKL